jgi:hypothetical protein
MFPDILDLTGHVPREYGCVQLSVEAALLDADGKGKAVVWLQSAFEGKNLGFLEVRGGEGGVLLLPNRFALPDLSEGRVCRWTLPLKADGRPKELVFVVDAPVKNRARSREPWLLIDAEAIGPLSHRDLSDDDGFSRGLGVIAGMFGGHAAKAAVDLVSMAAHGISTASKGPDPGIEREPYSEAPAWTHAVSESDGTPIPAEPQVELVWAPGMPLPQPPPPQAPSPEARADALLRNLEHQRQPSRKLCSRCYEMVDEDEAERERVCPKCFAPWS